MYCAGPPDPAQAHGDGAPRIQLAGRRVFAGSSDSARDPMLRDYLSDMVQPYGLTLDQKLLDQGRGHSYGEMAAGLIAETIPADEPVDLIVLAFAIHDVVPGRSTAAYLSHLRPDQPMAFAVCDQGAATPFTALQLISAYAQAGNCQRALLVVVEQAALCYELTVPAAVPAKHAAVTLLLSQSGPGVVAAVRQHAGIAPAQRDELLASELAILSAGRDDVTLITGNGLRSPASASLPPSAPLPPGIDQVLSAPSGQPCTGVWWELAGGLQTWTAEGRRVLLADYDPALKYLCVSAIDIGASPVAPALPQLSAHRAQ
jgi:hypothetical protein